MTTGTPSAAKRTSNSTPSAPSIKARLKAARVFSGAKAEAPRWPIINGGVFEMVLGKGSVDDSGSQRGQCVPGDSAPLKFDRANQRFETLTQRRQSSFHRRAFFTVA